MEFSRKDAPIKARFLWAPQMHNVLQKLTTIVLPMTKKAAEIKGQNPVDFIVIGFGLWSMQQASLKNLQSRWSFYERYKGGLPAVIEVSDGKIIAILT